MLLCQGSGGVLQRLHLGGELAFQILDASGRFATCRFQNGREFGQGLLLVGPDGLEGFLTGLDLEPNAQFQRAVGQVQGRQVDLGIRINGAQGQGLLTGDGEAVPFDSQLGKALRISHPEQRLAGGNIDELNFRNGDHPLGIEGIDAQPPATQRHWIFDNAGQLLPNLGDQQKGLFMLFGVGRLLGLREVDLGKQGAADAGGSQDAALAGGPVAGPFPFLDANVFKQIVEQLRRGLTQALPGGYKDRLALGRQGQFCSNGLKKNLFLGRKAPDSAFLACLAQGLGNVHLNADVAYVLV